MMQSSIKTFLTKRRNNDDENSTETEEIGVEQPLSKAEENKRFLRAHFPPRDENYPQFYDLVDALNSRQLLALSELPRGNNLFVTGCAGTGKTLWMRTAIALMQSLKKNVAVAATTALAASNIDVLPGDQVPTFNVKWTPSQTGAAKRARTEKAKPKRIEYEKDYCLAKPPPKQRKRIIYDLTPRTIHSWAGVGIDEFNPEILSNEILNKNTSFINKTRKRWQGTDVLFLDEVSMLDPKFFVALETMGRLIRKDSRPFGGLQIVIVADFFQLPPVIKNRVYKEIQVNEHRDEQQAADREELEKKMQKTIEDDKLQNEDDEDYDDKAEQAEEEADAAYQRERMRKDRDDQRAGSLTITRKQERALLLAAVDPNEARCCFQTQVWKDSIKKSIVLDEIFRQNNPIFIDILAELRRGVVSQKHIAMLEERTRFKLTSDLMKIAQQLFGNRNCDYLRAMSERMFQTLRLPQDPNKTLLEQCEIDVTQNFSYLANNSFIAAPSTVVIPNWDRMLKFVKQCAGQTEFDPETALIYFLPLEHIPSSHQIIVSEIEPTNIMSLNAQVDQCNEQKLANIKGTLVTFNAGISIGIHMQSQHFQEAQDYFSKEFGKNITPMHLRLKIGAQVLLTSNLAPRFYNGRRGVVVDFSTLDDYKAKYGNDALLLPREQTDSANEICPVVYFDNGETARIGRHEWERKRTFGNNVKPAVAVLSQIPLMLAFAITIHKSQGLTLTRLSVNLTSAFESGLPYVALSRGVNLESIVIEHMDRSVFDGSQPKLLPPAYVVAFYEELDEKMLAIEPVKE